jgi:hypothetical protein
MIAGRKINSVQEALALLNCHRLPARLNTSEVAVLLGFQEHDIAPLVAAKLLSPLGKPASNAPKYFAATEIVACAENRDWLSHATRAIARHWAKRNHSRLDDAALGKREVERITSDES